MNPCAQIVRIENDHLRHILFTLWFIIDAPRYFIGALLHGRLWHYEFYSFTWWAFWAAYDGFFVGMP